MDETSEHNKTVEQEFLAFLKTKPDRFTAYVGKTIGDGCGVDRHGPTSRRELTTWLGRPIGYCFFHKSWPVQSYVGPRMYQIYAIVNGVEYTGRGFGEGMYVNLRKVRHGRNV